MSAAAPPRALPIERRTVALAQARALARRAIVGFFRQPSVWAPGVVFPLVLAAVNSSAMAQASDIPGFPPDTTYLQFLLVGTVIQGVMFGSIASGTELALDIQNGFFERLVLSPVWRPTILLGRVAGGATFAAVQVVFFLLVLLPFGAVMRGGVAGLLVVMATAVLFAVGLGALAAGVGVRTGSTEAVQSFFPVVFVLLFMSSSFFPTQLMDGWFRWVAEHNPQTWLVDGLRHQVIVGFDAGEAAQSLAVAGAMAALGLWFAATGLRRRIRTGGS